MLRPISTVGLRPEDNPRNRCIQDLPITVSCECLTGPFFLRLDNRNGSVFPALKRFSVSVNRSQGVKSLRLDLPAGLYPGSSALS